MTTMTDQHPAEFDTTTFAPHLGELLVSFDQELFDRLHDDVTLRASGVAEWAGTYDGKEAVLAYAAETFEAFPDITIAKLRGEALTTHPRYIDSRERNYAALRALGMPA